MDSTSCLCDSSDYTDPTAYLETLKKKYLERTAKLQAQQQALEKKIMKMEEFIGKPEQQGPGMQTCPCDTSAVPRVFPETPVRDVSAVPKAMTDIIQNQQPVTQQCSFFQKMMENAKSILSIKCQCAFTSAMSPSASPTSTLQTSTATNERLPNEPPTKESNQQNVIDYDVTLTDKSSHSSTCSCDFTEPTTSMHEVSCSCHISNSKPQMPQSQQVSMEPSSSTPKETSNIVQGTTDAGHMTTTPSVSEKCPWMAMTSSELISGECSCDTCGCDSSSMLDDKALDNENVIDNNVVENRKVFQGQPEVPVPTVALFMEKDDNPDAEVQVATTVANKGMNVQTAKDTASKCVTCCKNSACSSNKAGKGDHIGIQVSNHMKNKAVNSQVPKKMSSDAVQVAITKQAKNLCEALCNQGLLDRQVGPDSGLNGQDQVIQVPLTNPNLQDGENQCAFIGSPLLDDFPANGISTHTVLSKANKALSSFKMPCNCNTPVGPKKICQPSGQSLTSNDILEMQNIAELARKEKEMKLQIQELQRREKQYQEATRNVDNLMTKTMTPCCSCQRSSAPTGMVSEIDKISRELRLENQILKSEVNDMKMELKHCLEKVEGPMKQKLETQKQKCECLQKDLQEASNSMLMNQDAYSREMNQLKLQLCCACTNITELNQMNQRMKDEMNHMDCLCQKLEDDLIKQKVNEAETIKRLTGRKYTQGDTSEAPCSKKSEDPGSSVKSDSNLDVIARKLSKTLKELGPCEECSKLPAELAGAARCIKELTDMVRKRKMKSLTTNGCGCQSRPVSKYPSKSFSGEDCCDCCGPRDGGGESARNNEKTVKTLLSVPESFAQPQASSKFDVGAPSSYYSAKGEPVGGAPCADIGTPCFQSKGTVTTEAGVSRKIESKRPCTDIGEPCKKTVSASQQKAVPIPSKVDKSCRAPCSELMEPVKDQIAYQGLAPDKDAASQEKPVQVPEVEDELDEKVVKELALEEKEGEPDDVKPNILTTSSDKRHISVLANSILDDLPDAEGDHKPSSQTETGTDSSQVAQMSTDPQTESTLSGDLTSGLKEEEFGEAIKDEPIEPLESTIITDKLPDGDSTIESREGEPVVKLEPAEAVLDIVEEVTEESGDPEDRKLVMIGEREIPFDEKRFGDPFPLDVEEKAFAVEEPVLELHVTTTITSSGTLEIITEGPAGTIGTTLTYTDDGNIEVVTEMAELGEEQSQPIDPIMDKFATRPPAGVPYGSSGAIPCNPSSTCQSMEKVPGYEVCEPSMPCHDLDGKAVPKLQPMQVDSSLISGVSGPEAETPYTPSSAATESVLTSKLGSQSSGIKPDFSKTPDFSSDIGPSSGDAIADTVAVQKQPSAGIAEDQTILQAGPVSTEGLSPAGPEDVTLGLTEKPELMDGHEALLSEGTTSTAKDLKSGEVFTPDQVVSDLEMQEGRVKAGVSEETTSELGVIPIAVDKSAIGDQILGTAEVLSSTLQSREAESPEGVAEIAAASSSEKIKAVFSMGAADSATKGESKAIEGEPSYKEAGEPSEQIRVKTEPTDEATEEFMDTSEELHQQKDFVAGDLSTFDASSAPATGTTGSRTNRDCGCQSKNQTDQSCQCCECKTVGITTSGDKETTTETMGGTHHEPLDETKTDTDSDFVTTSETLDNAFAQFSATIKPDDTLEGTSNIPTISSKADKTSSEGPETITDELDHAIDYISVDDEMLSKNPELVGKTRAEQQEILKSLGYKPQTYTSKESEEDVPVDDELLTKHPELVGKTNSEQQNMLKNLGYTPPAPASKALTEDIPVDDEILKKYPDLVGKTKSEQQQMLMNLGYSPPARASKALTEDIPVDDEILKKHPDLVGKTKSEQQQMLMNLGYSPPAPASKALTEDIPVDDEILMKHPDLVGKTKSEQQQMLRSLGYTPPAPASKVLTEDVPVDDEILMKHPDLVGKTKSEQQQMLRSLGYTPPAPASKVLTEDVPVDDEILMKHPDLVGKTKSEQQQMLRSLGYTPPTHASKVFREDIPVDDELLIKHPDLVGKTKSEQQQMLKNLGYIPSTQASMVIEKDIPVDNKTLTNHPELVGKTKSEQQQILKALGYQPPTSLSPSLAVSRDLLEKHPELIGKSSEAQEKILKNLGYSDADIVAQQKSQAQIPVEVTQELLNEHPELLGKTVEEQQTMLATMGYVKPKTIMQVDSETTKSTIQSTVPSVDIFESTQQIPESEFSAPPASSKDASVVCKAPCGTVATSTVMSKKSSARVASSVLISKAKLSGAKVASSKSSAKDALDTKDTIAISADVPKKLSRGVAASVPKVKPSIEKLSTKPSSREVSVSCKAPCRSAATIHSVTPKQSENLSVPIGDASATSMSKAKSKSVSLQKTPSARDDESSCQASCKTVSIQSSKIGIATTSPKDIEEIVAARSESTTTTTSTSSDAKQRMKMKNKPKNAPGEVPSIVSELSDKERPVIESTKKPRSTRKRRLKVIDCMKCNCQDPCSCAVCSPGRKKQQINRPVRSCDCPPPNMMMTPMMIVPPIQMTYSMPPTGHAANCRCNACLYIDTAFRPPDTRKRPDAESPTSDEPTDDGRSKKIDRKHPSTCECVDCLCLPKIKKLANTKECPIVYDTKQVYQVKLKCDTCKNAQNRSRIPISTSSPNPPKAKSDSKPGTSDGDGGATGGPPPSTSDSVYNSVTCDCPQCVCADCPDDSKKKRVADSNAPAGDKDCTCDKCDTKIVDELAKKLGEAEAKLANYEQQQNVKEAAPAPTKAEHAPDDGECNCTECICPRADLMPGKEGAAVPPPVSDQPAAEPPSDKEGDNKPPAPDAGAAAGGGAEDCNCKICECPGKTNLPPKSDADTKPGTVVEVCDCADCKCSPCADPNKQQPGGGGGTIADCDCSVCKCSPCADPKKHQGEPDDIHDDDCDCTQCTCFEPAVEEPPHDEDCDCPVCACPGAPAPPPEKAPHPEDCDCAECVCPEEVVQTEPVTQADKGIQPAAEKEVHALNCACPECLCPECSTKATHAPGCKCDECVCDTCSEKGEAGMHAGKVAAGGDHAAGCTCIKCRCDVCSDPSKKVAETTTAVDGPVEGQMPRDGCKCAPCLEPEDCLCGKPKLEECQCAQCLNLECPRKVQQGDQTTPATQQGDQATTPTQQAGQDKKGERGPNCACADCICVDCNKGGAALAPESAPPGSEAQGAAAGDHGADCDCADCKCQPCMGTKPPEPICMCTLCTCADCSKKREASGEGAPSATAGDHGADCDCAECKCKPCFDKKLPEEICTCAVCTCVDCTKKREASSEVGAPPAAAGDHGADCDCADCKCKPCFQKKPPEEICTCAVCTCVDCTKKREASGAPPAAAGDHGADCDCADCKCKPCFQKKTPEEEICTCAVCTCVDCRKKREEGAQGEKAQEKGAPGETAQGETAPADKGEGKTIFTDPPPFEPYERIDCSCVKCDCQFCKPKGGQSAQGGSGAGVLQSIHGSDYIAPPFEIPTRIDCICARCSCAFCNKQGQSGQGGAGVFQSIHGSDYIAPPFEIPTRIDCICARCSCVFCNKIAPIQKSVAAQPSLHATAEKKEVSVQPSGVNQQTAVGTPSATAGHPDGCGCAECACQPCKFAEESFVSAKGSKEGGKESAGAIPVHCDCPTCTCNEGVIKTTSPNEPSKPAISAATTNVQFHPQGAGALLSEDTLILPKPDINEMFPGHPKDCTCPQCQCQPCLDTKAQPGGVNKSTAANQSSMPAISAPSTNMQGTTAPSATIQTRSEAQSNVTCVCTNASASAHAQPLGTEGYLSDETLILPKPDIHEMFPPHPKDCNCAQCQCQTCLDTKVQPGGKGGALDATKASVKTMDNVTLAKSIQAANKESCECKEQIEEIKRTLQKIKCACSEAEFRSTQSMAQTMGKDMKTMGAGKPFVKQAETFGQTMSGLKMALNNLQSKCKAKDRMIEAMTTELSQRGTNNEVFDKVLGASVTICTPLDYDQAEDVKSLDRSQLTTNVILPPTQKKDECTCSTDLRNTASKGVEVRTHKHKKKKEKTENEAKKLDDCACSNPQIVQKLEKDCQKLDLSGFEVVDIRRITDDSLIVKWNAAKNEQVQGYDIFVNGVIASKVMSGTRTSAMMHSLDLTKSVQITIYAITKCGRVEPPAIAIYEIKS